MTHHHALNCPVCTSAMQETTKHGVSIDVCTRCRGVWLDRGELEKLLGDMRAEMTPPPARHRGYDDDDDDYRRHASYGHHPRKKSKMETFMDIFD